MGDHDYETPEHGLEQKAQAVEAALRDFHQHYPSGQADALPPRHSGAYRDSMALTHCICWGGAWKMLDHLLDNPATYEHLRVLHNDGERQ